MIPVGREPRAPDGAIAEHLPQVETIAVEIHLDQVARAGLIMETPAELGVAHLALDVGQLEFAIAHGGEGRKREIPDRGLPRQVAIPGSPAGQRPQARALKLDGTGEERPYGAIGQTSGNDDGIVARQHRLQTLDGDAAVPRDDLHIETTDKIAAEARLFNIEGQRALPDRFRLLQHPLGEHVQDGRGRRLLALAGRAEQFVKIDPPRAEMPFGLERFAKLERQIAGEDLRAPMGVNGEFELRQLGTVRRRSQPALQFEEGGSAPWAARLWP